MANKGEGQRQGVSRVGSWRKIGHTPQEYKWRTGQVVEGLTNSRCGAGRLTDKGVVGVIRMGQVSSDWILNHERGSRVLLPILTRLGLPYVSRRRVDWPGRWKPSGQHVLHWLRDDPKAA